MPTPDVKVRLATNEEAPIVENLVAEIFHMGGWMPKFENIFPHWLVAEIAGEIVGTINLRLSNPISTAELMAMESGLNLRERTDVAFMLLDTARALAAAHGAAAISAIVPDEMESYLEALLDRGYVVGGHGKIVFGRML